MNDLRALVDDATPEGVPGFDAVLARRDQRSRRRRGMIAAASAAVLVVAVSLAVQWGTPDGDESPAPPPIQSPTETSSPTPTRIDRPDPTYTWSDKPSRVVVRLPERDVALKTWLGCWWGPTGNLDCVEEEPEPLAELPDVGSPEFVDFWFGVKGWTFEASFTELGVACPRVEETKTVSTGGHWFRLDPAGLAGDYRVDLTGYGPESDFKGAPTQMSFVWHTPTDGPVDKPEARVSSLGGDLEVVSLGFQPTSATARLTITAANDASMTRPIPLWPPSGRPCTELGGLYFQGDDQDFAGASDLGPGPFTYLVRLTLDGKEYVGTGTYPDDVRAGTAVSVELTWSPPLPAYSG